MSSERESSALVAVSITFMGYFFQFSFGQSFFFLYFEMCGFYLFFFNLNLFFIYLVHSPYLAYLRVLPCVCSHLLAKMDSTKEAYG